MKIVYDTTLDRPGCALLQGALGGDPAACAPFDTEAWLLTPTPDMHVYEISPDQLLALAERVNARG